MSHIGWLVGALGLWSLGVFAPPVALWAGWSAALAAVVLAAAAGAGSRLLGRLPGASEFERAVFGAALGLGILSLAVMGLAWAGLFRPWIATALVVAAGLWGVPGSAAGIRAMADETRLHGLWLAPSALLLAFVAFAAAVPPHQYDSLVYHLALPQAYLRQGNLRPVEAIVYSQFTQGAEMLYLLALGLGSDLTAQFLTAGATALTAAVVWALGKRLGGRRVAAAAVFIYSIHTSVLLLGSTTYVENWVGLWLCASVACFARWLELPLEAAGGRRWLALSGLMAGFAFDAKYYAAICPLLLSVFMAVRLAKVRSWMPAAIFTAAAALPALPWLAKNAWYVGNPVFPFFYGLFPSGGNHWAVSAPAYFKILTEYGHPEGLLREIALFPGRILTGSTRFGGGMDVLGAFGWPLVFVGSALAWASYRTDRLWRFVGFYLAGHFTLWFSTRVVLRFLVPTVGLFALAAAQGYSNVWKASGTSARAALAAGLLCLAATQLYAYGFVHAVFESQNVLFGLESPQAFLERRLAYYPCAKAVGELGADSKLLIVGEQRSYYVPVDNVPTEVYQPNLYQDVAKRSSDGEDFAKRLRELGFTHFMWVPAEAQRLGAYGVLDGLDRPAWAGLLGASKQIVRASGCSLYALP